MSRERPIRMCLSSFLASRDQFNIAMTCESCLSDRLGSRSVNRSVMTIEGTPGVAPTVPMNCFPSVTNETGDALEIGVVLAVELTETPEENATWGAVCGDREAVPDRRNCNAGAAPVVSGGGLSLTAVNAMRSSYSNPAASADDQPLIRATYVPAGSDAVTIRPLSERPDVIVFPLVSVNATCTPSGSASPFSMKT